jgi:hypothetical protein
MTATISSLRISRALDKGNSSLVTTFSITPPKSIFAIFQDFLINILNYAVTLSVPGGDRRVILSVN